MSLVHSHFQLGKCKKATVALLAVGLVWANLASGPLAQAAPPRAVPPRVVRLVYVGTHPQAAQQLTAMGRTISTLEVWKKRVYAGYGDYSTNTGPIAITPFDPVTSSFTSAPLFVSGTEAIQIFRKIGGRLYAPATDSRTGADYAVSSPRSVVESWEDRAQVSSAHVYDMVTLTGSDLWIVGSQEENAVAWRSLDGGQTWTQSLSIAPIDGYHMSRFYFAGVYNGKLYVQATDSVGPQPNSMAFDGKGWTPAPSLLELGTDILAGRHAQAFAGRLVYQGRASASPLLTFDGQSVSRALRRDTFDYAVRWGKLYALATDGRVYVTADLKSWRLIARAPATARSIEVVSGQIYVGTTEASLYRATL